MFTKLSHQRREKVFGEGRCLPLDRNAKARIMVHARALSRRTEKGKHYGIVTAKFLAILHLLDPAKSTSVVAEGSIFRTSLICCGTLLASEPRLIATLPGRGYNSCRLR